MRRSLDEGGSGRSMAQCGFVGDRIGIGRRGWTWTWVGGSGNGVASIENHLLISASKDWAIFSLNTQRRRAGWKAGLGGRVGGQVWEVRSGARVEVEDEDGRFWITSFQQKKSLFRHFFRRNFKTLEWTEQSEWRTSKPFFRDRCCRCRCTFQSCPIFRKPIYFESIFPNSTAPKRVGASSQGKASASWLQVRVAWRQRHATFASTSPAADRNKLGCFLLAVI